jgi:uncharacterized protein (DUF1697 family)
MVALLRGVNNAGPTTRVAMANLRALFEDLGFRDVKTLLNSGNVIFSVPKNWRGDLTSRIREALATKLGLTVPVIVLSGAEVAAMVQKNPLSQVASNPSWLLLVSLRSRADESKLKPLLQQRWTPEVLALGPRVAYLWCAKGVAKSPLWAAVERALEKTGTARNVATITKLLALTRGESSS